MDVNAKYKRWGWGAVIALIGVILVAGLIVAVSMSSPKPGLTASTDNGLSAGSVANGENGNNSGSDGGNGASDTEKQSEAEKKAEEEAKQKSEAEKKAKEEAEKKAEEERKAREDAAKREEAQAVARSNNLPYTGPTETISAFVVLAVIAYLVTLNVSLVKKQIH